MGPPVDVGLELVGESGDDALHDGLVLQGEVAAGLVGDGAQQTVDLAQGAAVALGAAHARQQPGEGQTIALARRALPARLDSEEPRHAGGHRRQVVGVVEDDEPTRPQPAPDLGQGLVAHRRVEEVLGDHAARDAGKHRLDAMALARPACHSLSSRTSTK